MSKMTQTVLAQGPGRQPLPINAVTNFMGGTSYGLGPLDTLKIVSASSIFGEPQYYRDGEFAPRTAPDGSYGLNELFQGQAILSKDYEGVSTSELFERVTDEALAADFEGTLEWAVELRGKFNMRLNPQVIMVRAAQHPGRTGFTEANPNGFRDYNDTVMSRADDIIAQVTYYLYKNGSKRKVPGILKRSWASKIATLTRYEMAKYKNHGIGMIDAVRISHASSALVDELMRTGTIQVEAGDKTWESLRSEGRSWAEILDQVQIPYMALLRNLRGIFKEIDDVGTCDDVMLKLVRGVERSRQFPFRYMSAMNAVKAEREGVHHAQRILDGLEDCMDAACANMPRLKGRSAFLSDNSGSAWEAFTSEYGSVTVANIDNLSSVIGAVNSDEGHVYPFGDRLMHYEISKRDGILKQANEISRQAREHVGGGTENGIWLFFKDAIDNKIHWDNIFIYSDQQAGHGGLYGTDAEAKLYKSRGFCVNKPYAALPYIDVAKLIDEYRRTVNPKVNVFTVQTAGYDNVMVPENGYRTSVLFGWTGRELVYADAINRFWNEIDSRNARNQ